MSRRLFTVEDTFLIRGRGLVLVPGIQPEGEERFRVGDSLLLKKPAGTAVSVQIGGLELNCPNPSQAIAVLLKGLAKDDVPLGTEVWSIDAVKTPPPAPSAPAG